MFGLTDQEAETIQTDPVVAVEKLIVRQLHGLAASGKRIVILVDALDEAQERGTNRVVKLLKDLGKAKTNALSLVVTMRAEPAANMQILTAAYGQENVMVCRPCELRDVGSTVAAEEDCLAAAPEWVAEAQANEQSKIFVAVKDLIIFCLVFCARRRVVAQFLASHSLTNSHFLLVVLESTTI